MSGNDELERLIEAAGRGDDSADTKQRIMELMKGRYLEMLAEHADEVRYEGGKGDTIDSAVVILGAPNSAVGINAEYRIVERRFGRREQDWHLLRQRVDTSEEGRIYDILEIRLNDGTEMQLHFEVTDFFGK